MDEAAILRYVKKSFTGIDIVTAEGNSFIFHDPDRTLPADRRLPFATLVTNDAYDQFSDLNRPSIFRLNIGVSKATFRSLLGSETRPDAALDFTALDTVMPHPVYGPMFWVCVLNPASRTTATVRALLAEAYERAAGKSASLP